MINDNPKIKSRKFIQFKDEIVRPDAIEYFIFRINSALYDEKILLGDIYIGMKGNVEKSRMVYRGVDDDFMNKMFFVVYEQLKEYDFTIFENTLINMEEVVKVEKDNEMFTVHFSSGNKIHYPCENDYYVNNKGNSFDERFSILKNKLEGVEFDEITTPFLKIFGSK